MGVATWVKSLGDFPLDPDRGKSWLWSGDGARLLWQSAEAAAALGVDAGGHPAGVTHDGALTSFAAELTSLDPDRQPIRVKQLPLAHADARETFTCLCRHVPLLDGSGFGLLAVAIGAAPRLSRAEAAPAAAPLPEAAPAAEPQAVTTAPVAAEEPAPAASAAGVIDLRPAAQERADDLAAPSDAPDDVPGEPLAEAKDAVPNGSDPPAVAAPGWAASDAAARRPLRFVWQTDADGRFAHVSRELAEAVGPRQAAILGRTLTEAAPDLSLADFAAAGDMLAGENTFAAPPVLWPATGGALAVPVELAGMPVREGGAFVGFRGYGIARIERAVAMPAAVAPTPAKEPEDGGKEYAGLEDAAPEEAAAPLAAEAVRAMPAGTGSAAVGPPAVSADRTTVGAADSRLTASERSAFREIARALGHTGDDVVPPAAISDDKPPLSPRQMPAWIARRQQARQAPAEAEAEMRPPASSESPVSAALVPFEAFQNRLDRRSREGATQTTAQLLDRLPLAVLVIQHGKAVHANPSFLQFAGYPDLASFIAAGGPEAFFTAPPFDDAGRAVGSIMVKRRDGVSLSTEAQVAPIMWDDSPATVSSFRPNALTSAEAQRLQRAEAALVGAESELQELRFVLDTATDGVLSLDAEGRIIGANRSAEALFGFDRREIVGESLTALLEPESHAAALDYLQGLKADGVATIMNDGRDVVGRERNGGRIPLFMTLGRLGGAEARFCAVLRDVTIWKKSEADLTSARRAAEDANANKSDFLARISHEIRTPMNAIIGFADVMRNETFGPLGNDRYKGYVQDIHASGVHVVSLVNDLLDLSKIAAGKLELTFGSVDVNQIVAESVSMMQPQANAAAVIVRTQLAQKLPPVVADQRSLRQIMLNLLSNAAKFTEAGGQVVVTTALTDKGEAAIRVRDTGVGMSAEEIDRAMEPFRQIPGHRSQGGTGLGLPLTKALAEANRAAFSLSSEPGKGTLVEIVFPATRVLAE
jgi:PAS domain S-box-containing protein